MRRRCTRHRVIERPRRQGLCRWSRPGFGATSGSCITLELEQGMTARTVRRYAMAAIALLMAVPAAAQTKDNAPVALPSARMMAQDKAGTESWTYAQPTSVFTKYRTVIVDPATVYQGPDAQFDGVDPADRQRYAATITDELRRELAKTFPAPA